MTLLTTPKNVLVKLLIGQEQFVPEEGLEKAAIGMLDELAKWTKAMAPMRVKKPE